ncbi:MAG TPA: adenylate/guanylate cyclase domain-containing protein [Gaiellaceae bacterium]|nr:adenylate/guanylate cyclase domain-containing protein [Gaiellaceae bacterium]
MPACPSCGADNPDGFAFCGHCGSPLASPAPVAAHEERKIVSVLFCDLVGFTAASESADPEDVRARIRPYHERLRADIEHFGGTVEKFIGDAVMAVFGAPVAHEDDAERAVRAGLRILDGLAELNEADPGLGLKVRIGINTGEALVSLDARPEAGEGIVTGDVVNTAARVQAAAPVDGVAVSEETYRQTDRIFVYEPLDPAEMKGKAAPVVLYQAVEARARFGSDLVRAHDTPFVGRQVERSLLVGLFDRCARDAQTQLVTLVGEPGAGKSRLCAELFAHIDQQPELVVWRQGRCLPYGDGITFWALGEIVKAHAGIFESDPPEVAAEKLDLVLPDVEERPFLRARLLPLLGIDPGVQTTREESFGAWRSFLESLAGEGPAVVMFEDLHWADPALLDFLAYLADWAEGVPLLLVCTTRPELFESHPAWAAGTRNAHTISLAPLTPAETDELVGALLARGDGADELRQIVVERSGGNPLYAEEFARLLAERREDAAKEFPDNVQALIAARLDTLPTERKSLLQDAAVVGKVFWAGALAEMAEREAAQVELELHELSRKELVRHARTSSMEGEAEYVFWHSLVRDVAYQQIPRAERARRHEAAAAWIERKGGDRVEDLAELLAHHNLTALELARSAGDSESEGRLADSARRYLRLAGERALGLDVAQAEARLARALELTPEDHPQHAELVSDWAEAAFQSGQFRESADALDRILPALRREARPETTARALRTRSKISRALGGGAATELASEAVALLESDPGQPLVDALAELSTTQFFEGASREAIATADRALELAASLGLPVPPRALGQRGLSRAELGELEGIADAQEALALAIARGDGRDAAIMMSNIAFFRLVLEGPQAALAALEEARTFSVQRNLTEPAQYAEYNATDMLVDAGRVDEALAATTAHLATRRAKGDLLFYDASSMVAYLLAEMGDTEASLVHASAALDVPVSLESLDMKVGRSRVAFALSVAGRHDQARETLTEIAALPESKENLLYPLWLPVMIRAAIGAGDPALAARLVEGVDPVFPMHEAGLVAARAALAEASGSLEAAADLYADAAKRLRSLGNVRELAYALLGLGRCLFALGQMDGATAALTEARDLLASLGFRPRREEAESLLSRAAVASA